MRLVRLSLHNWGVFNGTHEFNLAPARRPDGTSGGLVVFRGHNGTGKTTLFESMRVVLHGRMALGDRVSRSSYNRFVLSHLHRAEGGRHSISKHASLGLSFEYVESGRMLNLEVDRSWQRRGNSVRESLCIKQDGDSPDVDPADYQTWLNDLVPPSIMPICFCDGEQLDTLVDPKAAREWLGDTIRRVLGLDLVERLASDLAYYVRRQGGSGRSDQLRREVLRVQAEVDSMSELVDHLKADLASVTVQLDLAEAELTKAERRLAAEGGSFAGRRTVLQERLASANDEIDSLSRQMRDLSTGLLPLTLAPSLCRLLSERLDKEADVLTRQAATQIWKERMGRVDAALKGDDMWRELAVPPENRRLLAEHVMRVLREEDEVWDVGEPCLVHGLSNQDKEVLQNWIAQVLHTLPQQVELLGRRLAELKDERKRTSDSLGRAPDDEMVAPFYATIVRVEKVLATLREKQRVLTEQLGALQYQHQQRTQELQRASEHLAAAQSVERQLSLAERSRLVLREYQDALTRQRLSTVEERLLLAFNGVCMKEHLVTEVRIDPADFTVGLRGMHGQRMELRELSAGERELYALSLLQALRETSGRELPLAIDAPLARMDEAHRLSLVRKYIPTVGDQVILFVTDAEMDSRLVAHARDSLARIYSLRYVSARRSVEVVCDQSLSLAEEAEGKGERSEKGYYRELSVDRVLAVREDSGYYEGAGNES